MKSLGSLLGSPFAQPPVSRPFTDVVVGPVFTVVISASTPSITEGIQPTKNTSVSEEPDLQQKKVKGFEAILAITIFSIVAYGFMRKRK